MSSSAALVLLAAVAPFLSIDNATRLMMVGVVAVMAFLWLSTNFAERPVRPPAAAGNRSESIGRSAGRLVSRGRELVRKQHGD